MPFRLSRLSDIQVITQDQENQPNYVENLLEYYRFSSGYSLSSDTCFKMLADPSIRLREAIIEGNLLVVKRLLRRFPELLTNIDPKNGWSSLHYASYHGRYLVCLYLIQLGHDKHEVTTTFKGNTCAHLSLMNGHEQTTHLLLQYFPRFIDWSGDRGKTPVHIACQHDHFQCFNLLMGVGANLTMKDDYGDTPLHVCLEYGSVNCMKMLVLQGGIVDDNVKNKKGWRPSDVAATYEMARVYAKLLKEAQIPGIPAKPPYSSFRTPTQGSKAVFDDGPSPVLAMNSPHSLYPHVGNGIPHLPKISTSRRASLVNSSKSPVSNIASWFASKDSSLNNSSGSLHRRDTLNSSTDRQTRSSTEISPSKRDSQRGRSSGSHTRASSHGNTSDLVNKYLLLGSNENHENPIVNHEDRSESAHASPRIGRRRISLLNVPIAKLRDHESDSSVGG
ncbi:related to Target of rapamycin complex 2 subunit AVO2 [Zygosaccharomyces bailii]|nr:related to Target of rapamycin complex 2 subunit AVO2 [Zygosaccharomyces bailii]